MNSLLRAARPQAGASPPAIWAAFIRAGAWKNWVLLLQLGALMLSGAANIGLVHRRPDVVLVDGEGKGTFIASGAASEALVRFLDEQQQRPSDVTAAHFSKAFLKSFLAVNSATVDAEWAQSLGMMGASLRTRMEKEASAQKLIEKFRASKAKTEVVFDTLQVVERLDSADALIHVRATVSRNKQPIFGGPVETDRLVVDLIERVVPRSLARPDGLEVIEYRNRPVDPPAGSP